MSDLISRQAVIDLKIIAPIAPVMNGETVHYEEVVFVRDLEKLPSVESERKFIEKVFETLREMDDAIDVICNLDVDAVLDRMEVDDGHKME